MADRRRWIVLAVFMFLTILTRLVWLTFNSITTDLETRLHVPASSLMWFSIVFILGQVLLAIPAGMIIDRIGFRLGVGIGAILLGIFPALRLLAPESFSFLLAVQMGAAIAPPFIINSVTKLTVTWFPPEEEATAIGLGSLAFFLGIMLAMGGTPWLVTKFSYETMLMTYAVLCFVGTLAFWLLTPSNPSVHSVRLRQSDQRTSFSGWGGLKTILQIRDFKLLCVIIMIAFGVFDGLITWIQKILHDLHGMTLLDTGKISTFLLASGIVGCLVIPFLSDKIEKRKPFLLLAVVAGILGLAGIVWIRDPAVIRLDAMVLGFFLLSGLPLVFALSIALTGPERAGVSIGLFRMLGDIAGILIIYLSGHLSGWTGTLTAPLLLFIGLLGIALVLLLFIKEHD